MFDNGNRHDDDQNPPPTAEESYATSTSASNLRVGNDSTIRTPGDVIAAAGMNKHRLGLAIMRLVSEWNSGATPKPLPPPKGDKPEVLCRAAEITKWERQENAQRFLRLRSLPTVRAALVHYAQSRQWEEVDARHLVAAVLKRFLSPVCPVCEGRKKLVIPGTSRTGSKDCRACKGTGQAKVPHGWRGQAMLDYIKSAIGNAAADLREGTRLWGRTPNNEARRDAAKQQSLQASRITADAQEKEDLLADKEAVARHFKIGGRIKNRP